jgi:hypothetical protein
MENIIKTSIHEIIFNGGDMLTDFPKDWDDAHKWESEANKDKLNKPIWSWDCGFKLDYDGKIFFGLLDVSSRFYPPKTHYGPTWDGKVNISFWKFGITKKFDCETLDKLKSKVEKYVSKFNLFFGKMKRYKDNKIYKCYRCGEIEVGLILNKARYDYGCSKCKESFYKFKKI